MHVLLDDDQGRLTLRRLRPWHRMLARVRAGRLDLELAGGTSPEASAALAARAMRLTSMKFRRDLAASLQRILAAAGEPVVLRPQLVTGRSPLAGSGRSPLAVTARPPRIPLRLVRISQFAPQLAALARQLVEPGPVPARGVAMLSQLLADGTGPVYREASGDDLGAIIERAARALTL
jgi:hypothetical protein